MLGHRPMTMEDFTGMARRHLWLLVIPAILACFGTYVVSLKLPNRYESKSLILVEGQRIPDTFVKSVVTEDIGTRLSSMQELILSRTRLEPIVERYGLFNNQGLAPEDRVNLLVKAIVITPIQAMADTRASQLPGFRVTVTLSDARQAQQVCTEITGMFIEEQLKGGEQEANSITQFLDKEVADAQAKMNDQDSQLAAFKRQYFGALPDQEQTNLGLLTTASTQLDNISQAIEHEQQDKSMWESLLNQQISSWKASQQTGGASPVTMDEDLKRKEEELATLQEHYTDAFPSVRAKKDEIEQLKKKIAAADATKTTKTDTDSKNKPADTASSVPAIEPPSIQQLRLQISAVDLSIKEKIKQQQKIQDEYKSFQARVQTSPLVEQKYTELTRDFASAQADYNELLHKRGESAMSADLEHRQQGEHFTTLDAASLPESPSFPIHWEFAAGGLGGGLALGAALVLMMEMKDKSIRTEGDVELLLKLPTLVMVPSVESKRGFAARVVFRARSGNKSLPAGN
jgi:polysaccharide chain length determinant protein (PEP-CTERM system associated)